MVPLRAVRVQVWERRLPVHEEMGVIVDAGTMPQQVGATIFPCLSAAR